MVSTVGGTVKVKVSTIECGWKSSLCKPSQIWSVFFADGEERRRVRCNSAATLHESTKYDPSEDRDGQNYICHRGQESARDRQCD